MDASLPVRGRSEPELSKTKPVRLFGWLASTLSRYPTEDQRTEKFSRGWMPRGPSRLTNVSRLIV